MIDNNNILLNNPLIPPGYYFSKIIDIETEPSDFIFPKILIKLQLHKKYELENNIFHSILFPTENSYYHYKNFFETVAAMQSFFDVFGVLKPIFQYRNVNLCWRLSRCLGQANM